ncbi:MAG TPA: hypothetical protein VMC41_03740 [Candidatus Nanoarchaeia archaeon]|nr:hypothetical protein [Candidatus Nanoarchaeia archaeon]
MKKNEIIAGAENNREAAPEKRQSVTEIYRAALVKKAEYDNEVAEDLENLAPRKLLDKLIGNFPTSLKEMMIEDAKVLLDRLEKGTMRARDVNADIKNMAKRARESYIDGYGMLDEEYGKMAIMNETDRLLGAKEKSPEVLKQVAIINMDVNALKAVNELSGYAAGDEYLGLVVDVLQGGELIAWSQARRLKIIPIHRSGDEFYLIVVSEQGMAVEDGDLEDLQELVEKKVRSNRSAGALLDLSKKEILYKLYKTEQESADELVEKPNPELFRRLREQIPEGFEFRAEIATGAINLYDALAMDTNKKNVIKDADSHEKRLGKMLGSLKDVSESEMKKRKITARSEMKKSSNSYESMMARLYNFREAGILKMKEKREAAEKELAAEKKKNAERQLSQRELNVLNEEIIGLLKAGAEQQAIAEKEKRKAEVEKKLKKSEQAR